MPLILKEFVKKYNGKKGVGNTEANKGECVGLAMVYIQESGLSHIWGHAKDIFANALTSEYKKIKNAKNLYPNAGDIIVWDASVGGGFGHIAVVTESDSVKDTFTVFEQNNWSGDNDPSCEITTYTNWDGVIGWLHPLILDVTQEDDLNGKIKSLEEALSKMTIEKDKYKEKAKGFENDIKDLKKEIENKDSQYERAKELIEILTKQKQEAINKANEYSSDVLTLNDKLKSALESNIGLADRIKELESVDGVEYNFKQIKEIIINFISMKLNNIKKGIKK